MLNCESKHLFNTLSCAKQLTMNETKLSFLKNDFIPLLQKIPADAKGNWGVLNGQQMVEHFSDAVRIASGTFGITQTITPPDHLEKIHAFMMSEKPFKENTKNSLMPEEPMPVRHASMSSAIDELSRMLEYFFSVFEKNPGCTTINPFFGNLNYEKNVQLLHKHALHHLTQFGVAPDQ